MPEVTKRILIAEDNKALSKALELKLPNFGFSVAVAFDGEEVAESFGIPYADLNARVLTGTVIRGL